MPTYQYSCTECGEQLEVVQKFTDDALTTCPSCGGSLRKVFSAVGVVFKGSGFYRTDSRAGAAKSDSKPDSKSEPKSGSKTDSKSEATPGAKPAENGSPSAASSSAKSGKPSSAGSAA